MDTNWEKVKELHPPASPFGPYLSSANRRA